ncbi:protein ADM2a [Hoplias malabaricus]|uniref:protein ADM2a n=1 Tax=Hoplias malabaricus TaxID=27720 RepID=UPI0034627844
MKALLWLTVYCISLLPVKLQALNLGERLYFLTRLYKLRERSLINPESDLGSIKPAVSPHVLLDKTALWQALLFRNPPAPFEDPLSGFRVPSTSFHVREASTVQGEGPNQRALRSRRHIYIRGHRQQHHGQLMRVGCVLGTCQIQNLGHRLYQLVGQTGREDSAPMNPRNPHSYG